MFPFARLVHNAPSTERILSTPFAKIENKTETYKFYCEKVKIEREIGGTGDVYLGQRY
jgi:hypothetical protein